MKKIGIAIFDMDDTLVDKETVFVEAQEAMLQTLARHDPSIDHKRDFKTLREIDHELVRLHGGKHIYDYRKLAKALWLHFHEKNNEKEAATLAFRQIKSDKELAFIVEAAQKHDDILENKIPNLIDDAEKVLKELKKRYVLVLFSSGEKRSQTRIIKHHKLDKIFDVVFLSEVKNVYTFLRAKRLGERVFSKFEDQPRRIVVIGDRISQEIIPSKRIGLETVWIPGPYYPGSREEGSPDHEIANLPELLRIL